MQDDKKKKLKQALMATGGFLMILSGIVSLCLPGLVISTLALVLGIVSILCGACYIFSFWFLKRTVGAGFLLADGIVTGILGLLLLVNRWTNLMNMNVLFAMLLELIGISLIVFSMQARNYNVRRWWVLIIAGGVCMVLGLLALLIPDFLSVATGIFAGIILIVGGVATIVGMFMAYRNKDKIITIREKDIEFIDDGADAERDKKTK